MKSVFSAFFLTCADSTFIKCTSTFCCDCLNTRKQVCIERLKFIICAQSISNDVWSYSLEILEPLVAQLNLNIFYMVECRIDKYWASVWNASRVNNWNCHLEQSQKVSWRSIIKFQLFETSDQNCLEL